jgi:hypothetical protein
VTMTGATSTFVGIEVTAISATTFTMKWWNGTTGALLTSSTQTGYYICFT